MIKLVDALQVQPEAMENLEMSELLELHSVLRSSKQKKAKLQADIVGAQISKRTKAMKEAQEEQPEENLVLVENSVKTPIKPKVTTTNKKPVAKTTSKPKATTKVEDKPKAKATSKPKPKALEEMSQEELLSYIQQMQEQQAKEIFPEVIDANTIQFKQVKVDTVQDMQKFIIEHPMSLYLYMDEKLDNDLTQFTVLFANPEIVVMLDRTRQKNTTITLKPEQLKDGHYTDKNGKFPIRFYLREVKQQEKDA
jgi:hypothetical protein